MTIEKFERRTPYFFLSNMYRLENPIQTDTGIYVPTSEHAYQSAKFVNPRICREIASLERGIDTKERAHELELAGEELVEGWDEIKLGFMNRFVRDKFQLNPAIAELLVNTGDEEIVEGNTWGDRYWGVCPPGSTNGQNNLGKIHMQVRAELVAGEL